MNDPEFPKHLGKQLTEFRHPSENQAMYELFNAPIAPMQEAQEDRALLGKIQKFLRPGETTLNQFISRVGLGPRPLREWSLEKIGQFILLADARAKDEDVPRNDISGLPEIAADAERNRRFVMVGE